MKRPNVKHHFTTRYIDYTRDRELQSIDICDLTLDEVRAIYRAIQQDDTLRDLRNDIGQVFQGDL